jgi:type II secretory pathway pseudopilin PulG
VELLVVIAIIGILIALLLPAVQAARESARRSKCQAQMKQIAIACLNFEGTRGHLPSASTKSTGDGIGYLAQILPFHESEALHDLIRYDKDYRAPENDAARNTPVPEFRCPSQGAGDPTLWFENGATMSAADSDLRAHYVAINGAKTGACPVSPPTRGAPLYELWVGPTVDGSCRGGGYAVNGMIYPLSDLQVKKVTDGMTQTMMLGEMSWLVDMQRSWITGLSSTTWCYTSKNVRHPINFAGLRPPIPAYPHLKDLDMNPDNDNNDDSLGSMHPGGTHVAMGDASVHFINDDAAIEVLHAMASRAKSEIYVAPY